MPFNHRKLTGVRYKLRHHQKGLRMGFARLHLSAGFSAKRVGELNQFFAATPLTPSPFAVRVFVSGVLGSPTTFSIIFSRAAISCSPAPIAMNRTFPRRSIRNDIGMENTP